MTATTFIIFINDNGGASGNGIVNTPLRNWKGSLYEDGLRVPMILAGPGVPSSPTTPQIYDSPVHSIDILPTCLGAAGAAPVSDIDGVNLIPFLDRAESGKPHELLTGNWITARDGVDGISISMVNNGPTDEVLVRFPHAPAHTALYARLFVAF